MGTEALKAYMRKYNYKYYREHKEQCKAYHKTPEAKAKHGVYMKAYRQTEHFKEWVRAYSKRYYAEHKEVRRKQSKEYQRRRYARINAARTDRQVQGNAQAAS